jgi:predicted Holliday junction resolvase-like endonuclease
MNSWLNVILGIGALGSPISLVILLRQRWRKGEVEIKADEMKVDLDKAQISEVANRAAAINQDREQKREEHWQSKLDKQERKLRGEIGDLRAEVNGLKSYINEHIPWDWEAVRQLRLAGIEIDNPPSLIYIRKPNGNGDNNHG